MYWENMVFDSETPKEHGKFWEELLHCQMLTDNEGGYETRLHLPEQRYLDFCFPMVQDPDRTIQRAHLILAPSAGPLGGRGNDPGQALESRRDSAGNEYLLCAGEERKGLELVALQLACSDPLRDATFWSKLMGWDIVSQIPMTLAHPSGLGPQLIFVPDESPKTSRKNALHLDLRLEAGESLDEALATVRSLGGEELDQQWGTLPWKVFTDPSGNEFCILEPLPTA